MADQDIFVTRKRGRPRKGPSVVIRLPVAVIDEIDRYSGTQPDKPSRPEAIRRVLAEKLK
jgi:hypothetical protein